MHCAGATAPGSGTTIPKFFRKEMKMKKRVLSLVLAIVMVLSLLPMTALAVEHEKSAETKANSETSAAAPANESDGDGKSDDDGDSEPSPSKDGTLQFSTDLSEETVYMNSSTAWNAPSTTLQVTVGTYTPADGKATALPSDAAISYQWHKSDDDLVDDGDSAIQGQTYQSYSVSSKNATVGTAYYYVIATTTIDGVTYTGTSKLTPVTIGAANISVTLTVNDRGVLAADKNGNAVSNTAVSVTDLNYDGKHTYDEALQSAHISLLTAGDYVTTSSTYGLQVTKLWGVETSNTLFYQNGKALATSVGDVTVAAGDKLYCSVNQDNRYYSDKYTSFDEVTQNVTTGDEMELTLTDVDGKALSGIAVGLWKNGAFEALEGKTTDENGKVTLSFEAAGTYYVTAKGTVKDTVYDYSEYPTVAPVPDWNCPIMAPSCKVTAKAPGELKFNGSFAVTPMNYKVGEMADFAGLYTAAYYINGQRDYNVRATYTWYRMGPGTNGEFVKVEDFSSGTLFTAEDVGTWKYYVRATCEAYGRSYWVTTNAATVVVSAAGVSSGSADNGFVKNITYNRGDLNFQQDTTSYTINHYDVGRTDTLTLYLPQGKGLWYGYRLDGAKNADDYYGDDESTNVTDESFSISIPTTLKAGEVHVITVLVGTKRDSNGDGGVDERDEFDQYDAYNFTVTTVPTLSSLTVTDGDGNTITMDHSFMTYSSYDWTDLSGVTEAETVKLTGSFETDSDITAYVGSTSYASLSDVSVTLADYKDEHGVANVPVKLVANGVENTVTLHFSDPSLIEDTTGDFDPPVIVTQPIAESSIDKDTTQKLTVEVQEPENGTLSYQWYGGYSKSSVSEGSSSYLIKGATSASYDAPAQKEADDGYYYACKVTLTIDGKTQSVMSNVSKIITKLTYVNAPVFTIQPGLAADGKGDGVYKKEYTAGGKFDVLWMGVQSTEETVRTDGHVQYIPITEPGCSKFTVTSFYNSVPSLEGAKEITGTWSTSYTGGFFDCYLGFTPDSGLPEGTWYVCVVVTSTAKDDPSKSASTASDFIKLKFVKADLGLDGSGSAEDPYLLKTGKDFVKLQQAVAAGDTLYGINFKMTKDIELPANWEPMGPDGANGLYFGGTLDGGGHTLIFADRGKPLIHHAKGAEIRNLKIKGKEIQGYALIESSWINQVNGAWIAKIDNVTLTSGTSTLHSGLVAGSASSFNPIYISNCSAEEDVVIGYDKSKSGIGTFASGLIGSLTNCHSAATVYGVSNVGGLLGAQSNSMAAGNFTNCWFTGKIVATGNNVGGLMGAGYNANSAPNAKLVCIQNCYVSAEISGRNNVGGLLGSNEGIQQAWDNGVGYVRDNVFCGKLTGVKNVGALVGYYSALNKYNILENNYFYDSNGCTDAIGGVEHIDTSARTFGMGKDGIFYYDTSRDSLDDIKDFVDAEDKGTADWSYTSVSKKDHNRTDDPMGKDKEKLGLAVTAEAMADGTVLEKLNGSESSKKNWISGDKHPIIDDTDFVTGLALSGDYKTTYYVGDSFDTTGMVFTATWSNGTSNKISAEDVTITGFDSTSRASLVLTASYNGAECQFVVNVVKKPIVDNDRNTIKVSFTMLGDDIHFDKAGETNLTGETHTLKANNLTTWVQKTTYTVDMNATVWDVIQKALKDNNMTCTHTQSLNTVYIASVTKGDLTIGEFDNGNLSGWMYTLNGKHPLLGVAQQYLENGDKIVFHYTDDYTVEEGSEAWNGGGGTGATDTDADRTAADKVIKLIDAIDTVTENSGDKITAARKAYDALTTAQQKLVTNYQLLAKAETAFAELTGNLLFTDVKTKDYFYDAVQWAVKQKITNGMSATTFGPEESCTRAQMVTFLWRAAGQPKAENVTNAFTDIKADDYFYDAVQWAVEQGITKGITETLFGPEESCTRGQMAAFLYRNAQSPAVEGTHPFTDVKETDYYQDAVLWAAKEGITQGMTATSFGPKDDCTRGQMVTFLYRSLAG